MYIPKLMQLSNSSNYLKQYLIEFAIVAVFSEVLSQIHSIFFNDKDGSICSEQYILNTNNVLTIFLLSFNEYQIFKVKLLSKHII